MYKLLLVTDKSEILANYQDREFWLQLGFKEPRLAENADTAIQMLQERHIDAITYALETASETKLEGFLSDSFPILPVMEIGHTRDEMIANAQELSELLNHMHMDYSDDSANQSDMLQLIRHRFFRDLLGGEVDTKQAIYHKMKLLRSKMNPDVPCVIVDLKLPDEDDYLTSRWHYGNERMETALRNFFGADHDGLHILISVLPDNQIRMLCCPLKGAEVQTDSITATVTTHTESCIADVQHYLGMNLRIADISVIPGLVSLAKQD